MYIVYEYIKNTFMSLSLINLSFHLIFLNFSSNVHHMVVRNTILPRWLILFVWQ